MGHLAYQFYQGFLKDGMSDAEAMQHAQYVDSVDARRKEEAVETAAKA